MDKADKKVLSALLLLMPLSLCSVAAATPNAELSRCLAITDDKARLACYDNLARGAQPAQQFGRAERQLEAPPIESIESHIAGTFDGWVAGAKIQLANGQVWQVTDDSVGTARLRDPKVRVRRGSLGSFFMEIEGESRSPRVKRLK